MKHNWRRAVHTDTNKENNTYFYWLCTECSAFSNDDESASWQRTAYFRDSEHPTVVVSIDCNRAKKEITKYKMETWMGTDT